LQPNLHNSQLAEARANEKNRVLKFFLVMTPEIRRRSEPWRNQQGLKARKVLGPRPPLLAGPWINPDASRKTGLVGRDHYGPMARAIAPISESITGSGWSLA
jgi:hypothetical protein